MGPNPPSFVPSPPPDGDLHRRVTWAIVLSLAVIVGVFVAVPAVGLLTARLPPLPGCPGAAVEFGLASPNGESPYPTNSTSGGLWWYNFSFVHCAPTNVAVTWVVFETVGPTCSPEAAALSYELTNASHAPMATENATTLTWSGHSSTLLPASGFLVETARADLSGDLLLVFAGGPIASTPFDAGALAGPC